MYRAIIFNLIKAGLDGIEVIHPNLNDQRTQHLQEIARRNHLLISGGSDCHGTRDSNSFFGQYKIPYVILDEIRQVHRARWGKNMSVSFDS